MLPMADKVHTKTTTRKTKKTRKDCFDNCDVLMEEFETINQTFEPHTATSPKTQNLTVAPGLKEIGRAGWTVLHTFAGKERMKSLCKVVHLSP